MSAEVAEKEPLEVFILIAMRELGEKIQNQSIHNSRN